MSRAVLAMLVLAAGVAHADSGRLLDDDTFAVGEHGQYVLDGTLLVASPSSLPTGVSTGVAAGISRECGCNWSYGARASWSSANGASETWIVTDQELRVRATAALRRRAGRGTISLRAAAGATIIYEDRVHQQGMRAGLTGDALENRQFATLPAGELEAVIGLHVAGAWLAVVSAGPELVIESGGHPRGGFAAQLGVAWQP
jgi:hypothetical protein